MIFSIGAGAIKVAKDGKYAAQSCVGKECPAPVSAELIPGKTTVLEFEIQIVSRAQ